MSRPALAAVLRQRMAAHQTPPFMGQGLRAGVRDAANLAWKLADGVQGLAPEALLDSDETERSPHAREFIETVLRLGRIIQATDPAEADGASMAALLQRHLGPAAVA